MKSFIDTNILVYTVDRTESARQAVAQEVVLEALAVGGLVVSTQVMQEFYNTVLRKGLLDHERAVSVLREWARGQVVANTPDLLWAALDLKVRWKISMWDALVVQAALEAGCTRLFTEDLHHGLRIGELEVVNPFRAPPAVHEPTPAYRTRARSRKRA